MSAEKKKLTEQKYSFDSISFRIDYLLSKKKWNDALALLKRGNEEVGDAFKGERGELFRQLRLAYLFFRLGDVRRAQQYLEQIIEENENEGEALLLMGYFFLLAEKKEESIYYYTKLLTQKEYQQRAEDILSSIKKESNVLALTMKKSLDFFIVIPKVSAWLRTMHLFRHFFPYFADFCAKRSLFRLNFVFIILFSIIVFGGIFLDKRFFYDFSQWIERKWEKMSGIDRHYQKEGLWSSMDTELAAQVKQPIADSLKDIYRKMEKDIFNKNINSAIVHYNKALLYNPPVSIRQRFEILATFIPKPRWNSFLNKAEDRGILRNYPSFYRNTYWKFSGKVSNVVQKGDSLRFHLLVFEKKNFREVVTIEFKNLQIVPMNGRDYEVLARFSGVDQQKNLSMSGIMMRRNIEDD